MAAITLDIGGNTRQLDRDIQKTVSKVYSVNLKTKGDQPLGRITGKVNEFTKSLDASNARVIAFGASAGIIYGLEKAFSSLVSSTIEVQKSLQDINVILNVSTSELQKFGGELFNIAKNTGKSFNDVATAATEFSRQGLGVAETLKRTNEALILSRLSGLDAAKSVSALTAAVNSFASQAVTATEVVNKFANVDAAFAVSSADLAEAISRVGSSAAQSGVSLNELIAIVTSAQQTTARGGAVIGNSFKTIFTRLERGKVQDLLGSLGISATDSSGQLKSTIQLLQDLGKVYDTLGSQQQSYVAEQVGGVFQINILKSALSDLGKQYSIYNSALNVAAGSTDQAIKRNAELNKTYVSQLNALQENAKQIAAGSGQRLLGPSIDRLVGGTNTILSGINESDGQSAGAVLGKGILDGIGQFIAGPGIALVGGVLLKLFRDLGKFATGSVQQLLGLNTAATQQESLQQSINQILSKNPELLQLALKGEEGLNAAANQLLANLQKQTIELQRQATVAAQISKAFYGAGARVSGGVPVVPTKGRAAGFVPNSISDNIVEKYTAMSLGATPTVRPHMSKGTIGGRKFVMNDQETEYPGVGRNGDSMVIPNYGDGVQMAARGIIPNFAATPNLGPYVEYAKSLNLKVGKTNSPAFKELVTIVNKKRGQRPDDEIKSDIRQLAASRQGVKTTGRALQGEGRFAYMYAAQGLEEKTSGKVQLTKDSKPVPYSFTSVGTKNPFTFEDNINNRLTPIIEDLAKQVLPTNSQLLPIGKFNEFLDKSAFSQVYGRLFEAVVNRALSKSVKQEAGNQRFEFFKDELGGPNGTKLQDIFNAPNLSSFAAADLKFRPPNGSPDSTVSFIKKMASVIGIPYDTSRGGVKLAARGFIPNFSAIQDAISREQGAGIPKSQIYIAQHPRLAATGYNPLGLGVFNKIDEPTSAARNSAVAKRGYASGFVPNFAIEDPDTQSTNLGTAVTAITAQLSGLAFAFAFNGNQYKQSLNQLTEATRQAAVTKLKESRKEAQRLEQRGLGNFGGMAREDASKRFRQEATPSIFTKGRAFAGANTFGLAIAAPILAETIKNIAGQETATGRRTGAVASGLGQIGSFAATGAMVAPGPVGAGVGAAVGALLTIPVVIKEFTTQIPELAAAAKKASQDLTKFSDLSQRVMTLSGNLSELVSNKAPQEQINKIQNDLAKTYSELEPAERKRIESAIKLGALQEELAKITQEKIDKDKSKTTALALQDIAEKGFIPGVSFDPRSKQGREDSKVLTEAVQNLFATGKTTEQALANLKNVGPQTVSQLEQLFKQNALFGDKSFSNYDAIGQAEQLGKILESAIPDSTTKADTIKAIVNNAAKDYESLAYTINNVIGAILSQRTELEMSLKLQNDQTIQTKILSDAQREYTLNVENTTSALNKVILTFGTLANALDQFNVNEKSFAREQSLGQNLTLPKNIAETVLGTESDTSRFLGLFEKIAQNENQRLEDISKSNLEFKTVFRNNLDEVFSQRLGEIQTEKTKSTDLRTKEGYSALFNEIKSAATSFENGILDIDKALQESFSQDGLIDPNTFKSNLESAFQKAGFKTGQGGETDKILNSILTEATKQNSNLLNINQNAKQQNVRVAQEFKNEKILLDIRRSLEVFGGVGKFLTPPDEGIIKPLETLIRNTTSQLQSQRNLDFGRRVGALTATGTETQVKNNIDLGRSSIDFIKQLKDISGGAFAPDPNSELYRTGLAGLTQSFENNIKQLDDILKNPKIDQAFKVQIRSVLESIRGLGSTREIAQLQMGQQTGTVSQSSLEGALSRLQDPVIESLRNAGLGNLADEIAKTSKYTSDPIVNALNVQKGIQAGIATQLSEIKALVARNNMGNGQSETAIPGGVSVSGQANGYIPALNKESRAIKRGVGGAKSGDSPKFIPNLNGNPAFVNTGEKLVPNFAGTGQTAVLTREMQKAVGMASGFIPNFAGEDLVSPESFKQFSARVSKIYEASNAPVGIPGRKKGQKVVEIITEKNLDRSFIGTTINFGGQGKTKIGKIGQLNGPRTAYVVLSEDQGKDAIDPKVGTKFNFNEGPKPQPKKLTPEEEGVVVQNYIKEYKRALKLYNEKRYEDAYFTFKKLKNTELPNLDDFTDSKGMVGSGVGTEIKGYKANVNKLLQETYKKINPSLFPEGAANSAKNPLYQTIKDKIDAYLDPKAVKKATATEPNDLLTDALQRSAKVTSTVGKYTGLNIGSNEAFGRANERPKVKIDANKGDGANANSGPFVYGSSDFVEFYSKNPRTDTLFNEATHVNQNLVPGNNVLKELEEAQKAIKSNGGTQSYLQRLKKFADFIEKQNQNTKTPFVDISRVATQAGYDQRRFGNIISEEGTSELLNPTQQTRYIQERASTLNDALSRGITSGDITAKELGLLGIPLDVAKNIVAETLAIDKQLKEQKPYQASKNPTAGPPAVPGIPTTTPPPKTPTGTPSPRSPSGPPAVPGIPTVNNKVDPFIEKASEQFYGPNYKKDPRYLKFHPEDSATNQTPTPLKTSSLQTGGRISEEEARSIVQELDATYNPAIRNSRSADQSLSWARTKQRYKMLYAQGKYEELEKFYNSLRKNYTRSSPRSPSGPPAVPGIPTRTSSLQTGGRISEEEARSIVQELDATYNPAIRNSRSADQSLSWARTKQRYKMLYAQGKYEELEKFYNSLRKNYTRTIGQTGRGGDQIQTNYAEGFIPNFAKDYISNLAKLESGLSGKQAVLGYDKQIGMFMRNKGQSTNLNSLIAKDHPEGKMSAIRNSMKMQKSVGVMNKGYIPNFASTDQSFTQVESNLKTTTSALISLSKEMQQLGSVLNNLPNTLNDTVDNQITTSKSQPNITTNTNAPINVVVNAESETDITTAIKNALEKAIPIIIEKVRLANGEKIPPSIP